jgi:TetR/AcrR family transcriptional repressor of nem operon
MTESSQKAQTRARILDEAAKAMREHGAEGIGVAALMKRAGLTHGGFYAHFENRDDLVAHAVDRMFRDSNHMLDRTLGQPDAAAGLRALIDYYLSDRTRARVDSGCPLPTLSGEAGRFPTDARQRFGDGITRFRSALAHALRTLGSEDPEARAASVLAEMVGAMALARAVQDEEQAREILRSSRDELKRRLGL